MLERMCRYDLQQDVLLIIASTAMSIVSDILIFVQEGLSIILFLDSVINHHPAYGICNQYKHIRINFYPLKWGAILVNYAYVCTFLLQRSLATDLQNLSMELRRKQSTYLKRLRQQKEVQTKFSS